MTPLAGHLQRQVALEFGQDDDAADFDSIYGSETATLGGNNYGPAHPCVFREMMDATATDHAGRTFVDIGSGKGRALLLAAHYPFDRILGIETQYDYCRIAKENVREASERIPDPGRIEIECTNALWYVGEKWPQQDVYLFMFRPFIRSRRYEQFFEILALELRKLQTRLTLGFLNPPDNLERMVRPLGLKKFAEKGMQLGFWQRIFRAWECYR